MRFVAFLLAACLSLPASAAEREVIQCDWKGLRQEMTARNLAGRKVRIRLAGGAEIKTRLLAVEDGGAVTRLDRSTRAWKSTSDRAIIPAGEVKSVRFEGHTGKGRLIGSLVGLGAGAGIAAAIATGTDCYEGGCLIVLPAVGVAAAIGAAIAGYYIGRSMDRPGPEFVLHP